MASKPFRFLVGEDKQEFSIHSALVTHHSKPLGVLINGSMLEAKEGCAVLDDISSEAFVCFSEYAYTGEYTDPEPDVIVAKAREEAPHDNEDGFHSDDETAFASYKFDEFAAKPVPIKSLRWESLHPQSTKKKKRPLLREEVSPLFPRPTDLHRREILWKSFRKDFESQAPPSLNMKPRESWNDFTGILLCHAQVYVLADKYQIESLAELAVERLRGTLGKMPLRSEELTSVTKLLEYTYSHTIDGAHDGVDMLRELVVHYAACVVEFLDRDDGFRELLENEGAIGRDLIRTMLARLD